MTGEFPAQMASNAETASIWWRHHVSVQNYDVNCECGNAYGVLGESPGMCDRDCDGDESDYSCGGTANNEIYAIGGEWGHDLQRDICPWWWVRPWPSARYMSFVVSEVMINNEIYVLGGERGHDLQQDLCPWWWVMSWTTIRSMSSVVSEVIKTLITMSLVVSEVMTFSEIYVLGGERGHELQCDLCPLW